METTFKIQPQPDDTTCGPTCLQAVYAYWGDPVPLDMVIDEVECVRGGGTLEVMLGLHALQRGYRADIYTYNLRLFDPTWFTPSGAGIAGMRDKLRAQRDAKKDSKLRFAAERYLEFLELGGRVHFQDMTSELLRGFSRRGVPVLAGLSATYLYKTPREFGPRADYDDIRGEPAGHFVVVLGYNQAERKAVVADPLLPNPMAPGHLYEVRLAHLVCAIMLGIVTFDASLLVITPKNSRKT